MSIHLEPANGRTSARFPGLEQSGGDAEASWAEPRACCKAYCCFARLWSCPVRSKQDCATGTRASPCPPRRGEHLRSQTNQEMPSPARSWPSITLRRFRCVDVQRARVRSNWGKSTFGSHLSGAQAQRASGECCMQAFALWQPPPPSLPWIAHQVQRYNKGCFGTDLLAWDLTCEFLPHLTS